MKGRKKIKIQNAKIVWVFGNSSKNKKMEFAEENDIEKIADLLKGCAKNLEKREFAMFSAKAKGGHICLYYNPKKRRPLNINLSAIYPRKAK